MTATATQPAPKQTKPSRRAVRLGVAVNGVRGLALTDAKGVRCGYWLRELRVDFGRGFELTKFDTEESSDDDRLYHVHLDAQLGDSCTCKGHVYRSKCKHVDALRTLAALGQL